MGFGLRPTRMQWISHRTIRLLHRGSTLQVWESSWREKSNFTYCFFIIIGGLFMYINKTHRLRIELMITLIFLFLLSPTIATSEDIVVFGHFCDTEIISAHMLEKYSINIKRRGDAGEGILLFSVPSTVRTIITSYCCGHSECMKEYMSDLPYLLKAAENGKNVVILIYTHEIIGSRIKEYFRELLGITVVPQDLILSGETIEIDGGLLLPFWSGLQLGIKKKCYSRYVKFSTAYSGYLITTKDWQTKKMKSKKGGEYRTVTAVKKYGKGKILVIAAPFTWYIDGNIHSEFFISDEQIELYDNLKAADLLFNWLVGMPIENLIEFK